MGLKRAATWSSCVLVGVLLGSGCLSRTHQIPKRDLMALATMPPDARGQRVRVVQNFAHDDGPPEQPSGGVIVTTPVRTRYIGPHPRGVRGGKGVRSLAKSKADDARAWLIVAAIAAVALATTEGARFDGWVNVNPGHPLYLFGYGGYQVVRLQDLTEEQAAWAHKAMIHPRDGAWRELERAPLNRQGWTYSVLGGVAQIPGTDGTTDRGFLSHIQFGFFPLPQIGFAFDIALGWRDNNLIGETVFESRHSLEVQVLPLAAGSIHAGGYGSLGVGLQLDDGAADGSRRSMVIAGGGMLQLELTTRLALTGRAGFANLNGETVNEFQLGLSIY